jgi:hypothetical protein
MKALQNLTIFLPQKRVGLFGSDWWEGAVFSLDCNATEKNLSDKLKPGRFD